ncbi:MAG: hypothetical protein ABJD97_11455 [Betaproteobacteria bacterium]
MPDCDPANAPAAATVSGRRGFGQPLGGVFVLGLSIFWLAMFSTSLWTMPGGVDSADPPDTVATASYLPEGKSRLGLTADGELHRQHCEPLSRLCRFVMAHSPVDLTVRIGRPRYGLSDAIVFFA